MGVDSSTTALLKDAGSSLYSSLDFMVQWLQTVCVCVGGGGGRVGIRAWVGVFEVSRLHVPERVDSSTAAIPKGGGGGGGGWSLFSSLDFMLRW